MKLTLLLKKPEKKEIYSHNEIYSPSEKMERASQKAYNQALDSLETVDVGVQELLKIFVKFDKNQQLKKQPFAFRQQTELAEAIIKELGGKG